MNIQELDAYNLDDAVKFNDHLNPKLWDSTEHLKPEVKAQLLRIADDFREFLGVTDLDLEDITISGSNAAYTYTPNSDIDLHLVVKMPADEVYRELFDAKKFQYNEQHNITIGGYDVELYVQDADQPHISQGIYSVVNNDWIQVPRRVKSVVDDTSTKNKFKNVGHQIERAIASGSLKRMTRMAEKIKRMRQTGLEEHGEFGPENLAFKMLRSQGVIKQLYDARNAAKDQELSLRERRQPNSVFTYGFKHEESAEPRVLEVAEPVPVPSDEAILKDFIDFCFKELKLKQMPTIKLRKDPQWSVRNKTFGRYINDQHLLEVAWGHRHIMDVLRTVAHELTHKHQHERDGSRMGPDAGETGSPYENEANARAGILMRDYARLHPEYFAVGQAHDLKESAGSPNVVTRIDDHPIEDFAANMQTYYHTDDWSESGQFPKGANIPKKFTGQAQGVYAGSPEFTALYATGSSEETRYVAKYGPGQPIVWFDRKDLPRIRGKKTYLTTFNADNFKKVPSGEYFSSNPGKPVEQKEITDPFQYITDQGWVVRTTDNLPAVLKKLQAEKDAQYGSEGMGVEEQVKESASGYIPTKRQAKDPRWSMALTQDIRPGQLGREANKLNLKTNKQGVPQVANPNGLFEKLSLELSKFKKGIADEDYSPDNPPGPESKPTMPKGTVRVDVSDMYDWYKLGKNISNLKGVDKNQFGKGPPSTIVSFGDEDTEHKYIKDLENLGLSTTDIDPVDPNQPKGMPRQKTDPTYNVNESQLDEVRMAPSNLMQWARSPEAAGIRAGFEAELIFRDARGDSNDDFEMEPDYDMDERCRSLDQVVDFFENDEYGYGLSSRQADRLREGLDEQYYEWFDEQMHRAFSDEAEDLIRKVLVDEGDWDLDNEIQKQLALLDLSDDEINAIINAGERAPKFTTSKEQQAYAEANPLYQQYLDAQDEAEGLLDDLVNDEVRKQGANWDAALDDFRDGFYIDDDSSFFDDVGLRWMSDIAESYDLNWPYWTGSGGSGSRDPEEIADSLANVLGTRVKFSGSWHSGATGAERDYRYWYVEGDGSLKPDDSDDAGLEVISPPLPLLEALEKLQELTDWANSTEGNAYTNSSTGLHIGVSVPHKGGDVDYVKLILFMGDEYVLKSFGREASTYCKSAMSKFKENIRGGRADPMGVIKYMQSGLLELAHKDIQKGVGTAKFTSAHIQDGYIEFRSPGGDWLAEESADPEKLSSTMLRFARAMQIAADPSVERREYAKKLYKLVAPEGDNQLALFAQYNAGELDKEQLKKRWAEKTIGKELKTNQRWKLFHTDGTPVTGQEYNGYTEDEAWEKAWKKLAPGATLSGFKQSYELRNMSEEQQWEVYDVNTGATLEIVKGKNRGEAADKVFDKYASQKIGFNVRPYQDPATLTPRAKLAKRISEPKQKGDWDVIYKPTGRVIDNILRVDREQAQKLLAQVAVLHDFENADDLEIRPQDVKRAKDNAQDSADLQANLTGTESPFREPQDATDIQRNWRIVNVQTGQVMDTVNGASYHQADAVTNDVARRNNIDVSLLSLQSIPGTAVSENFDNESLNEKELGRLTISGLTIIVDDHAMDRTVLRNVLPTDVDRTLRKLPSVKEQIQQLEDGQQFWIFDQAQDISLGMRCLNTEKARYVLKTVLNRQPYSSPTPVITVGDVAENFAGGKVNEVVKMPPVNMVFSNENLVDWAYNDAQEKQARQLSALKTDVPTKVYDLGDHVRVFVLDDQGPVLYLALEKFLDGFKTNAVQIRPRGQGKNLGFKIYQAVSDTFQRPLYSDYTHTDASRLGIWKKLIDQFPDRMVGYDQRTKEDLPLSVTPQGPAVRGNQPVYAQRGTKDQSKPVTGDTRSRTRLLKFLPAVNENFADGKGPGRPGDSQRHGIPKGATMAELEKASHAGGRKGQLARWQLNMRRGKKK